MTLIVTRRADGALAVEPPPEEGVDQEKERMRLITARVGKHWYLSVSDAGESESGGYLLVRYEFRGPKRVVLFAANPELLLAAIARKQVAGEKVPDRHMESIKLTSDAAALRAFIAGHGAEVFEQPLPVIDRVR